MPRTSERGGPATRARIQEVANRLFQEVGFDAVTVARVAREAGVSSVTVFNHFASKEDLFFDRSADTVDLLRTAVRERPAGVDALTGLRDLATRLLDEGNALSGVSELSIPFFRTVAHSPALVARARGIAAELQSVLVDELEADPSFDGDSTLLAAFFVAGYATVFVENARRLVAGETPAVVAVDGRGRLERLFSALRDGLPLRR